MKLRIEPNLQLPVRADYSVQVDELAKELRITDLDSGGMSVTNDLERVLLEISQSIDEELPEYSIVYRDSTGTWDRIYVSADPTIPHAFDVVVRPGP